jgi:3-hydroxyisobutyrate dehydrogenase-like beta-hydroxyacid dehydrogenase
VWTILAGRPAVASAAEVPWLDVERVLVVVRLPPQVDELLPQIVAGLKEADKHGVPVHVVTTLTPDEARRIPSHADPAVRLIEDPLTGGEPLALQGVQTAMLAGDFNDADVAFLRESLMEEVVTFAEYGEPALVKLLNNLACSYNLATFATVLKLGVDAGIEPTKLQRVINRGSGASFSSRAAVEIIGDLLAKDVAQAVEAVGDPPLVSGTRVEEHLRAVRETLARPG